MQASRISAKGQVTIPKEIREVLKLEPGDLVAYELQNGTVTLKRVEPLDTVFHEALSATLDEWNTPEDDEAFRDL
ncbi:MAG: AbrB/MazE/SpoVT family DNA-binding domain-containing protein [Deltaproteobacteria bacterium]|nr:AbrB/MazE/SpoVT family DNA-binding domain-containing protein [Deltaproteobacteria bacterium]